MHSAPDAVVGRDAEFATVDAFLHRAQTRFAVLTLEGEAGIGKTTVWRESLRRASAGGFHTMLTRPRQAEAALSFTALMDLFDELGDTELDRLPEPQRDAISAALLRTDAPAVGIDERALCAAVLSLLRLLSTARPLLIAVDDAQWLDVPSDRALSFVVRRLQAERVGFLVTARTGAGHRATFDRAADRERRTSVRLGPLSVAALHETIKQHTGRSLPRPLMVRLTAACGGNPFYALEVAEELGDQPQPAARLPVPATLTELVASRVRRLPQPTRHALLAAAMLSRPAVDHVDREALRPAERVGIVSIDSGRINFVHPLFAAAIQSQAGDAEQRRMHRSLAHALDDPEEQARHAALSVEGPDAAIAAALESAATLSRSRGAPAAAAELLELAVALTPSGDEDEGSSRRLAAATSWFDAGDLARSQAMSEEAVAGTHDASLRARALHLLGQVHARRSSYARALECAEQALDAAPDDALRAELEMDIGYYATSLGKVPLAMLHTGRAVSAAEQARSPGLLAEALAVDTMVRFLTGQGMDEAQILRARRLDEPARLRAWQYAPAFVHGSMLLYLGRLDEARSTLEQLHRQTLDRGEESPIPFSCYWLAWTCLWSGDFPAARRYADEALQTAALLDDAAALGIALTASALVNAHVGSVTAARREANAAAQHFEDLGWAFGGFYARWALGLAELSAGNPAATDAAVGRLAAMLTSLPGGDPMMGASLPEEIEALVELGELDRAEPMVRWLEERGAALDRPWARAAAGRCRGLLCAARGDSDAALAALTAALAQHERSGMPFERARTLLVQGALRRRRKQRRLAGEALQEARTVFEQLGARLWAARAQGELDRLGRRTTTPDALTNTERHVAELAAAGLANRQIAQRVFLTPKSVEANLTRAYRKLGIRSRGGIARALQRGGDPGAG